MCTTRHRHTLQSARFPDKISAVCCDVAFSGYLGDDKSKWAEYDATELLKSYSGPKLLVLIDTGTADNFYQVLS